MPCFEATLNKFYITLSSAITRNFIHFHLPKYVQAHDFVDTSYNPITQLLQHCGAERIMFSAQPASNNCLNLYHRLRPLLLFHRLALCFV
tara:strand:- start:487 stop:756 length:270 start_codon:yes stop_codon:yes gene_type:complete